MNLIPRLPQHSERILVQFIQARFEEAGSDTAVIGLSGGLDSALNLKLITKALGPDRVSPFFLPYGKLSGPDVGFSEISAKDSGVSLKTVDISEMVDRFPIEADGMVKGNLMARTRMIYLYTYANKNNGLVIGTSNKTELLMGYFTKYGDGAADIYPTGDLFKTQTRELSREIGVPEGIIERPPSAGLMMGQTDEGELGIPYPILDQVLNGFLSSYRPEDIPGLIDYECVSKEECERANFDPPLKVDQVKWIDSMVKRTRHKRTGLPIPKVNPSTIGIDIRERW